MDAFQDRIRIEIERVRHVADSLGPEGLLRVDPDRIPVHPPVVLRTGHVHRELMPDLGLPAPESPYISVIACVSSPPPSSSSRAFEQVVSFATDFRRSRITSPVSKPPMSTASRAAMMIL